MIDLAAIVALQVEPRVDLPGVMDNFQEELIASVIRLPLAAALGTVLALRPRRNGTPERQPAVVQTQIILAVVGSLIMLVVGASLARAFGVAGAANLIRYRSKIDDPKDAVVMLCALSAGLAAGVGLYGLSVIGTLFIVFCLWIIEGFEPQTRLFELSVKLGDKTQDLRPKIEEVLRRPRDKSKVAADVRTMRTKIEDEKGTRDIWDLKHVRGGLIDIEFLTQFLQIVSAHEHPEVLDQNTVGALNKLLQAEVLTLAQAEVLIPAATLYHTLTQCLRLCLDKPFVAEEAPRALKDLLARASDMPDFATLEAMLKDTLAAVHELYEWIVR